MRTNDAARLVEMAVSTAVWLLEAQDGLLYPIAHAIDTSERSVFIGAYDGGLMPDPTRALENLRAALRNKPCRSTAVIYGIVLADDSGRNALCIEFESLDAPAETIVVPFIITRPRLRAARVITYAPMRLPGANRVLTKGCS
jgi:hypothetical protein